MTKPKQRRDESSDEYAKRLDAYKRRRADHAHRRWAGLSPEERANVREYQLDYAHKIRNARRRERYAEDEAYREHVLTRQRLNRRATYARHNARRRERYAEDTAYRARILEYNRGARFKRRLLIRHPKKRLAAIFDFIEFAGFSVRRYEMAYRDPSGMTLEELIRTQNKDGG